MTTNRSMFRLLTALSNLGLSAFSVDVPPVRDHGQYLDALTAFFEHQRLTKVHIIGFGLGGFYAQLITAVLTDNVDCLILVDPLCSTFELS